MKYFLHSPLSSVILIDSSTQLKSGCSCYSVSSRGDRQTCSPQYSAALSRALLFCSLAVLDPRVGHTMDVLSPFIPVLCQHKHVVCSFCAIAAAVPPRPQDDTACFSHRTLHHSVQLCDRLQLLTLQGAPVTDLFVKCHLKLHIDIYTDITLYIVHAKKQN